MSHILTRARIVFIHDVIMAALSFIAALYLRVGGQLWWYLDNGLWPGFFLFVAIAGVTFIALRMYRGVWRYASMNDLLAIAKAATLTILIFVPVLFLWTRLEQMPRSLPVINWFVLVALLGGPRLAYRLFKDRGLDHVLELSLIHI